MKARQSHINYRKGIALVITLLMLSVITFLAVAFLVMTRRDTSAKLATLDVSTAQSMSEAALARAQAEIIARMTAQTDVLAYDYMASSNYITLVGYTSETKGRIDTNNVNYDYYSDGSTPFVMRSGTANDWAQNIANLFFDPRPPVFVMTNTDPTKPASDFRYYVDLNRNGAFEGSSFRTVDRADHASLPVISNRSGQQGEPEWIGVLADPTHPHSASNPFVGRYAYMVLPIGKTLDLNYIHNESQRFLNGAQPNNSQIDEYVRDQGVGSWELNLAGYLRALNTNIYGEPGYLPASAHYQYIPPNVTSQQAGQDEGLSFVDARSITTNRLAGLTARQNLINTFGAAFNSQFQADGIDEYGVNPLTELNGPFDFTGKTDPESLIPTLTGEQWPGSYASNMLFDMQDIFNPSMTSIAFTNRLAAAGGVGLNGGWPNYPNNANFIQYDRYTYQRMLATIGTGSQPDNGLYVYADGTNAPGLPPTYLKTKMNLNYDNSLQMAQGPYSPMPTNPVPWSDPLKFFTNAADLLLRTQTFVVSNVGGGFLYRQFGINSMNPYYPIYTPTNSGFRYTAQLHRMLQLAANLYDEGHNTNTFVTYSVDGTNVVSRFPSVFRPMMLTSNQNVYIVGYERITLTNFATQFTKPWMYLTNSSPGIATNDNVYGVPWVVGAVKGLPTFNQLAVDTCFGMTRKVQLVRPFGVKQALPNGTNQLYLFSISNRFGIDAWNSYQTPVTPTLDINAFVQMEITFTNNSPLTPWGTNIFISTNVAYRTNNWSGWVKQRNIANSMAVPILVTSNIFTSFNQQQPRIFSDVRGPGGGNPAGTARGFWDVSDPKAPPYDSNTFSVHGWQVNVTNYVRYVLQDDKTKNVLDFVNIGPIGTSLNITQLLNVLNIPAGGSLAATPTTDQLVWNPAGANDSLKSLPSAGELNQIRIGAGYTHVSDWQGPAAVVAGAVSSVAQFQSFITGGDVGTNVMDCPLQPSILFEAQSTWAANDPLVHYTVEDLTSPVNTTNVIEFHPTIASPVLSDTLGQLALRYEPWPSSLPGGNGTIGANYGLKDPQIVRSDSWNFPTNPLPNVGWIGRVHRGTPWQTIYLKADPTPETDIEGWLGKWVGDLSPGLPQPGASYPTNDWALLDLFTTAPNDNAMRGTLSINQTNAAAWHALLDGVIVLTNQPDGILGVPINPAQAYGTNANTVSYILDSPEGINTLRTNFPGKLFHRVGDILESPTLTTASPYIDFNAAPKDTQTPRDEVLERIPQQVAGLLKVGQPQFVIYAWGQSLRPAALFNSVTAPKALFKLCTNYTITGEYLTRTVCHLDLTKSDRFGTNAHIQVDSFNILPAAQ